MFKGVKFRRGATILLGGCYSAEGKKGMYLLHAVHRYTGCMVEGFSVKAGSDNLNILPRTDIAKTKPDPDRSVQAVDRWPKGRFSHPIPTGGDFKFYYTYGRNVVLPPPPEVVGGEHDEDGTR